MRHRLGVFFIPALLCWTVCWLVPGLLLQNSFALLNGTAPLEWRGFYVVCLYVSLLYVSWNAWKRTGPKEPKLLPFSFSELIKGLILGCSFSFIHRFLIRIIEFANKDNIILFDTVNFPGVYLLLSGALSGLAVASAEELVFRGYLYGVAKEEKGRIRAYIFLGLFFALLHLLRPGDLPFKLMYGLNLLLLSFVLCKFVDLSKRLYWSIGLHAGIIMPLFCMQNFKTTKEGYFLGLNGDPNAGFLGVILLGLLFLTGCILQRQITNNRR